MQKASDDSHLSMAYSSKGKLSKRMLLTLICFIAGRNMSIEIDHRKASR